MSLIALLFNNPQKTTINVPQADGSERELLILDATLSIAHDFAANTTEFPVEDGSSLGDNVDVKPISVSIQGIMSEAPISLLQAAAGTVAGAVPTIAGKSGSIGGTLFTGAVSTLGGLLLNQKGNRVRDAHNALLELMDKKIPTTLITGLQAHTNMFLTSYKPTETPKNGHSLSFSATFKEMRVAKSEQIVIPQRILDDSVKNKASSNQNVGKKTAGDASDDVAGKGQSFLTQLTGIGA